MSQPPSDHNASLLWALWHNIDPSELLQQSTELERADTLSVRSEVPNKYTPSYAFPLRKPQYPETTRLKAMQNEVRTRYCSDVPQSARLDNSQQLEVLAKSSTLCDPSSQSTGRLYHSETFLTEMPEFLCDETDDSNVHICMPAFLPTIQAKAHAKKNGVKQLFAVRKYLEKNNLLDLTHTATTPRESLDTRDYKRLQNLEQAIIPYQPSRSQTHKQNRENPAKHKAKFRQTGNKTHRVGKVYMGRNRDSSTTLNSSNAGYSNRKASAYDSIITSQDDLVNHFSRISMRQVQATINNNKTAILPGILPNA